MIPQIGSQNYLPNLIAHIQANISSDLILDKNIFLGIFLCLIAGQRNLIVDVDVDWEKDGFMPKDEREREGERGDGRWCREREIGVRTKLKRVAEMCQAISGLVFSMSSQHTHISTQWTEDQFASLLFPLVPPPNPNPNLDPTSTSTPTPTATPPISRPRPHHNPSSKPLQPYTTRPIFNPMKHTRAQDPMTTEREQEERMDLSMRTDHTQDEDIPHPLDPRGSLSSVESAVSTGEGGVGMDIKEVLVLTGLEEARPGVFLRVLEMLQSGRMRWTGPSSPPSSSSPEQDAEREQDQPPGQASERQSEHTQSLPTSFICIYVRPKYPLPSSRFSPLERQRRGERNQTGKVPDWLIDRFAVSCSSAMGTSERGWSWESRTGRGEGLVDAKVLGTLRRLSEKTHMHPPLRTRISDLTSCTIHHPHLSSIFGSTSISDLKTFVRISRILFRPFAWKPHLLDLDIMGREYDQRKKLQAAMEREEWYAVESDVRMVWGNLVRHRIGWRRERERALFSTMQASCQAWDQQKIGMDPRREEELVAQALKGILITLG